LENVPDVAGDPLREYWLEEVKAMALGAARSHVREHIDRKYRPGKMSNMAPGSLEDWPVTQQTQLFSLLGDVEGAIGVTLTDSFLMVPLKSVSGMLFPTERSFESCQLCPREGCPGRAAPYDEHLWDQRYAEAPSSGGCREG
jgi:cobalamin-dependent methionine synthase I